MPRGRSGNSDVDQRVVPIDTATRTELKAVVLTAVRWSISSAHSRGRLMKCHAPGPSCFHTVASKAYVVVIAASIKWRPIDERLSDVPVDVA